MIRTPKIMVALWLGIFGIFVAQASETDKPDAMLQCSVAAIQAENEFWSRKVPDGLDEFAHPDWFKRFGGRKYEDVQSVVVTPQCDLLIAGSTSSSGSGNTDAWVLKLDMQGEVQWEKTYGGKGAEIVRQVLALADGGFVIVGHTGSSYYKTHDMWSVRANADGEILWQKTLGGKDGDDAAGVALTKDGGFLVAGRTESKGEGAFDAWLVKLDASGNRLWDTTFGGAEHDSASAIAATQDGNFILAGTTNTDSMDRDDAWLIKVNGQGKQIWEKRYGGKGAQRATSVLALPDGSFVVVGATDIHNGIRTRAWAFKSDPDGNQIWDKTFTANGGSDLRNAILLPNGDILMGGTGHAKGRNIAAWLLKINADGDNLFEQLIGIDAVSENGRDLALLPGGQIVLVGTVPIRNQDNDAWVAKLQFFPR